MLALLLSGLAQGFEAAPPSRFDRVIALAIDAQDEPMSGYGRSERIELAADFSGTLHLWTSVPEASELDLFLRVEAEGGALLGEDDDSGGGRTPYLSLAVEPGRALVVRAAATGGEALGAFALHAIAAPESEATRAAAQSALESLVEVRRLRAEQEFEPARLFAQELLDGLLGVPGAAESESIAGALWKLVGELDALSMSEPIRDCTSHVLKHRTRTLPEEHRALQEARYGLATALDLLGDLRGARELDERVVAVYSRTLAADDPELAIARGSLAATLHELGDLHGAAEMTELAITALERSRPEDDLDLLRARSNYAATLCRLGDIPGALALQRRVLELRMLKLPPEHADIQRSRQSIASMLAELGDLEGARELHEAVLEAFARTLPDEHPLLQQARLSLATVIFALGDLDGARGLFEELLAVFSRTLPDDHPELQFARANLAATLQRLGDLEGAQALGEKALDVLEGILSSDHPDLQRARGNLATVVYSLGDRERAQALQEQVLEVFERTLPDAHPDLQTARQNLAMMIREGGDLELARALGETVVEIFSRTLPGEHSELQRSRLSLAETIALQCADSADHRAEWDRCAGLMLAVCRSETESARAALLEGSAREARARCESVSHMLGPALSFAAGYGLFEARPELDRAAFTLSETTRAAGHASAAVMRWAASAPEYANLRAALRAESEALAGRAQQGTTSAEFQAALTRREALERELIELAREVSSGAASDLRFDPDDLAARLSEHTAVVGYRRFYRSRLERAGDASAMYVGDECMCALVLRRSDPGAPDGSALGCITRVDLGPLAPIEEAVQAWRARLGASGERGIGVPREEVDALNARGAELRALVFDPLLPALGDAQRVVLALDDVLHLVPIDALPIFDASGAATLVGERWRVETRCTLMELLSDPAREPVEDVLVALGGPAFNSEPEGATAEQLAPLEGVAPAPAPDAAVLRGGAWERGFTPLTHTGLEAREIAALHDELFEGSATSVVLEQRQASRASLEELAPRARFLHVATHGWFARESIRSWSDPEPLDAHSGLGSRASGADQVQGMSPMLLCGLALAGANLPAREDGRSPGLMTAEELAALDLRACELAVLSACDTNVGVRRAGQGIASLQMALQMAGARSVITSLWKVPDEATRALMTDFYRRLWAEGKPKAQALWEAKMRLRDARDEHGEPLYAPRDWAAWVLSGDPE